MTATVPIPEDLVDLPPGPELAAALAGIDFTVLSGWDCVEVLNAQSRQVDHERARLMAVMVETGRCDLGPDDRVRRVSVPGEFDGDFRAPDVPAEHRAAVPRGRRTPRSQIGEISARNPAQNLSKRRSRPTPGRQP